MTGSEDDRNASFDPRSWLGGESGASSTVAAGRTAPRDSEPSFDPSTWGKAAASPKPAPGLPKAADSPKPPTLTPTKPRRPIDKRRLAALGGVAALLGASLGSAYMTRGELSTEIASAAPAAAPSATPAAAPVAAGQSRRTISIAGPEQLLGALTDLGVPPEMATALAGQALGALGGTPGELRLIVDLAGTDVAALEATRADGSGVRLTAAEGGGYSAQPLVSELTTRIVTGRGEMDGQSFYSSAIAAGINDSLISDFANAFGFDVNFQTEVLAGDVFEAAFEQDYNPAGEVVGTPRLLFVSLRLKDKSLRYYRFTAPGETEASWFDANGRGNKRSLMRTPIDGARITSKFGPRFHPVLHYTRLHGGTDFAAPVGTPIYAAAAGVVVSATFENCGGNMVVLRHDTGWLTRYFHSSRYADGIVAGARVTQGQTVSYVGNTGKCTTGPHLHYEVHVNGEKVDPMSIDTSTSVALEATALAAFTQQRERVDQARAGQGG